MILVECLEYHAQQFNMLYRDLFAMVTKLYLIALTADDTLRNYQKMFKVGLAVNNKFKHIGYFNNIELAELVAIEARDKYHGAFACHK